MENYKLPAHFSAWDVLVSYMIADLFWKDCDAEQWYETGQSVNESVSVFHNCIFM